MLALFALIFLITTVAVMIAVCAQLSKKKVKIQVQATASKVFWSDNGTLDLLD